VCVKEFVPYSFALFSVSIVVGKVEWYKGFMSL